MSDQFDPDNFAGQESKGGLPAEAMRLSKGAQDFIRQYVASDDESGRNATFYLKREFKPFLSTQASEREKKPVEIFEEVMFINITVPGNDKIEVDRPASELDKRTFPYAFQQYERGQKEVVRGTPLQQLGLGASFIRAFAAKNVFTVEDLASVNDNNLQHLGLGSREMRAQARDYVDSHKNTSQMDALNDASSQQAAQIATLVAQVEKLAEDNKKLSEKRGPGRPPKVIEE